MLINWNEVRENRLPCCTHMCWMELEKHAEQKKSDEGVHHYARLRSYKVLEQAKLIHGQRQQTSDCLSQGVVTSGNLGSTVNVLFLDCGRNYTGVCVLSKLTGWCSNCGKQYSSFSKIKHRITTWFNNSTSRYTVKRIEIRNSKQYLSIHVHNCIIHNSRKVETT